VKYEPDMKKISRRERLIESRSPNSISQPDFIPDIRPSLVMPIDRTGIEAPWLLQLFPHFFADSCLMQYPQKGFSTYVALMRIGDSNGDFSIDHKLVFTP
jgi:hypothetical protein